MSASSPWEQGRAQIHAMINTGDLELVTASPANADRLLLEADRHLRSARTLAADDPAGAYDLLYAAARKALSAALAVQGLRATSQGGHRAVQDAITYQLGRAGSVVRPFGRLRRTRNDADYPKIDTPSLTTEDATDDLEVAAAILSAMKSLVPRLGPWR